MQKKYASDRHKTPRKMLWVPEQEWLHFEKVIQQLRNRTKVDDLQYGQAFKLVLKAAEKHLNVGGEI